MTIKVQIILTTSCKYFRDVTMQLFKMRSRDEIPLRTFYRTLQKFYEHIPAQV